MEVSLRAIFISYRREDSQGEAGRLFDDLTLAFSERDVFMDVDAIQPGRDFRKAIQESVLQCRVLLCIIGVDWLSCAHATGGPRLNDPNDYVRLEIAEALRRDIPVIPVLVQGARMPKLEELPPDLIDLAYRNAVELAHARWKSDVQVLIRALRPFVVEAAMTGVAEPLSSPRADSAPPQSFTLTAVHRLLQQVSHPSSPQPGRDAFPARQQAADAANLVPHVGAPASDAPAAASPSSPIEPAAIERVSKDLANYIGPIAEVVVRRAAKRCGSLPDLYASVAKEIEAAPDRARFLAQRTR